MALQGTIETFALPDVMRLLASTNKTGRLRLSGSRGSCNIWVEGGKIVASETSGAPHANGAVEVAFELLRFKDGDFVFDSDSAPTDTSSPMDVEPVLGEAEAMLEEWKGIEAVVPSLESWVALSETVPGGEVTIDADRWKLIVAVGGGASVGTLGDRLSLGEMPISKLVKELKEAGLAQIGEDPLGSTAPAPTTQNRSAPAPKSQPVEKTVPDPSASGADFESFDPGGLVVEEVDPAGSPAESSTLLPPPPAPAPAPASSYSDPGDAAEIARQLANLSPKAAKAVAAAAKATTQEERELALAEVDEQEDPINRDLLIKFLGSVNG